MDIGIVSMRYAKALMEYAKSMGAEDTLYKEFCMLDRSFRKHPDLRMALENPILTIREKLHLSVPLLWGMLLRAVSLRVS
jgi:F-type H+-transporting ATPase subunit delta